MCYDLTNDEEENEDLIEKQEKKQRKEQKKEEKKEQSKKEDSTAVKVPRRQPAVSVPEKDRLFT